MKNMLEEFLVKVLMLALNVEVSVGLFIEGGVRREGKKQKE